MSACDLVCLIMIKKSKRFRNSVHIYTEIRIYSCLQCHSGTSSWQMKSILLNHASVTLILSRSVSLSKCTFFASYLRTRQNVKNSAKYAVISVTFASIFDELNFSSCESTFELMYLIVIWKIKRYVNSTCGHMGWEWIPILSSYYIPGRSHCRQRLFC